MLITEMLTFPSLRDEREASSACNGPGPLLPPPPTAGVPLSCPSLAPSTPASGPAGTHTMPRLSERVIWLKNSRSSFNNQSFLLLEKHFREQ